MTPAPLTITARNASKAYGAPLPAFSVTYSGFVNGDSFDTTASAGSKDGLNFNGNVGIGPYSVVIFAQ